MRRTASTAASSWRRDACVLIARLKRLHHPHRHSPPNMVQLKQTPIKNAPSRPNAVQQGPGRSPPTALNCREILPLAKEPATRVGQGDLHHHLRGLPTFNARAQSRTRPHRIGAATIRKFLMNLDPQFRERELPSWKVTHGRRKHVVAGSKRNANLRAKSSIPPEETVIQRKDIETLAGTQSSSCPTASSHRPKTLKGMLTS